MTKQANARNFADDAKNISDDVTHAAADVAADATNRRADAGKEAAERTVSGLKDTSERALDATAGAQKSMGENMEKFSDRLQGLSSISQQNLQALARSSEISAKALESIRGEIADYTKKSYEDRIAAAQDIAKTRNVAELVEKQTSFAQHAFEAWAHQAVKLSAIYTAAAKDIASPLAERFSSVVTKDMKSVSR